MPRYKYEEPTGASGRTDTRFIVKEASARMPSSVKARYVRVAVIELEEHAPDPKMISKRARGVVAVVATWERCFDGKTRDCAAGRAREEAQRMATKLNSITRRIVRNVAHVNGITDAEAEVLLTQ